jgi:hypothetical protein
MFDPECLTFLFVQLHFLLVLVGYTGQPEILWDVILFDMQVYQILVPVGFSGIQSTPGILCDVLTFNLCSFAFPLINIDCKLSHI